MISKLIDIYFKLNGSRGVIDIITIEEVIEDLSEENYLILDSLDSAIIKGNSQIHYGGNLYRPHELVKELQLIQEINDLFIQVKKSLNHSLSNFDERIIFQFINISMRENKSITSAVILSFGSIMADRFLVKRNSVLKELLFNLRQKQSNPIVYFGESIETNNNLEKINHIIRSEIERLEFLLKKEEISDINFEKLKSTIEFQQKIESIINPDIEMYAVNAPEYYHKLLKKSVYNYFDFNYNDISQEKCAEESDESLYFKIKKLKDEEKDRSDILGLRLECDNLERKVQARQKNELLLDYAYRNLYSGICKTIINGEINPEYIKILKNIYKKLKGRQENEKNYFIFLKNVYLYNYSKKNRVENSQLNHFLEDIIEESLRNLRNFAKYAHNTQEALIKTCYIFFNTSDSNANDDKMKIHSTIVLPVDYEHIYNLQIIPEINKAEFYLNSQNFKKKLEDGLDEIKTNKVDNITILGIFAALVLTASAGSRLFEKSNISFDEYVLIFGAFSVMLTSFIALLYSLLNWNKSNIWMRIVSSLPLLIAIGYGCYLFNYERPALKKLETEIDSLKKVINEKNTMVPDSIKVSKKNKATPLPLTQK